MTVDFPEGKKDADEKALEFRLKLLKDEITAQANTFDQIDSKTGVALGFTFVVIGQVLASVFRMSTNHSHLQGGCTIVTSFLFDSANLFALFAIICGAVSRWPRGFQHSIEFEPEELARPYPALLENAIRGFGEVTSMNDEVNKEKGRWAAWTYLFVGLALLAYLALTVLLFSVSVTK